MGENMDMKKINLSILLTLVLLFSSISFAGISINNYTVSKSTFEPGDPGVFTLSVTNPSGTGRVESLTLNLDVPNSVTLSNPPSLSDISSGGSTIVTIPFRVKSDAQSGIYLLDAEFIGYSIDSTTSVRNSVVNTVSLPISIVREPIITISSSSSVLEGIDDVSLVLDNSGGPAKNLRIKTSGNISLFGKNEIFFGDLINNRSTVAVTLDSRSSKDGPQDIIFDITYDDELGNSQSDQLTLRASVNKQKLNLIFDQESEIVVGKESSFKLTLRNTGPTILKNVRLVFDDSSEISLKERSELRFGDVASLSESSVTPIARINLAPGLNQVKAKVFWVEKDVEKEQDILVPLTVSSDAQIGVYLEGKPSPITIGTDHTISVQVSNLGSYSIESVDVTLDSPAFKILDISNSQFIGSLEKDDFSTVQFKVRTNPLSEGEYPINLKVNFRDGSGEWKTQTITRNLSLHAPVSSGPNYFGIILALIVIGSLVWYFKFRKPKVQN